jgi:uncharacterized protein
MVHGPGLYLAGFAAALIISAVASPAGVSGAVLLLPFQVSVLGTPSPAVTPTNLLFNVIAAPGALYRYWRQNQTGGRLTALLLAGTVPGVVAGSVLRVELLPGPRAFEIVIAVVLIPLGAWLAANPLPDSESAWLTLTTRQMVALSVVVGTVGGIYGIGGGSILAPILIGAGNSPRQVAPATLASTFITSVVGVVTFVILATGRHSPISPDWGIGLALGLGGLIGGYLGALAQPHLPDRIIRRTLGLLVMAIGARYAYLAARR